MEMELLATENFFEDKKTGEIKVDIKYFIYHPDLRIKIYLKPIDKTASDVLKFLVYENRIKNIPK